MKEAAVEAKLTKLVRQIGGISLKLAPVQAGNPDRLILLPGGRIELVEVKATGGRLHPAQVIWHERAAALGITVHVLTGPVEVTQWVAKIQEEL